MRPDAGLVPANPGRWRFPSAAGLFYLVVSSYLVPRLVLERLLTGAWVLDRQMLGQTLLVTLLQWGALELLRRLARRRTAA